MSAIVEKYYGVTFRSFLWLINPFKKVVIKTEANVHKFINRRAIEILREFGYLEQYDFLNLYLKPLNDGVVWADQDFKSINHFYNPTKKKGLYGHSNALDLSIKYYKRALINWRKNDIHKAMFYLGACVHIIQDLTIPQHVNIRLLDNHRQYETFVKMTYDIVQDFRSSNKPIIFDELEHYIRFNTKVALQVYRKFKKIKDDRERFFKVTRCALPLAQRTTAGCLLKFLSDAEFLNLDKNTEKNLK